MSSKRPPSVSIHRRILLVFLISIALPGLYLSYVGLRSIVQEQELQRGLLVQNVGRTLEFEIDRIEQGLERREEDIATDLVATKIPSSPSAPQKLNASQPWIEHAFVFDSQLRLRAPPPFASEPSEHHAPAIKEPSLRNKIESAEKLELRGDHTAALASYQQLLAEARSLQSRVVLIAYVARSAASAGNPGMARRAYEEIIESDSSFLVAQPIPYAAFAWLELVDDLVKQGKLRDALLKSLIFRQRLLEFYYRFSSGQVEYFTAKLQSLRGSFEKVLNADSEALAILHSLEAREQLLTTTLHQAKEIELWLQSQQRVLSVQNHAGRVSHHSVPLGDRSLSLSLVLVNDPAGLRHWVVLVVRPDEIQREIILPDLQSGDLADGFDLALQSDASQRGGETELAASPMRKTAVLFPSLMISVSDKQTSTIGIFGVQISTLSVGFGLFVIGIVFLGILFIYRDIRREEELSRMKSEFISNVSHELKTPIAAIRMLAENLRQSRVAEESRKMEYYQLISKESSRLSHLIDNILDFSRVEGKRKTFQLEKHDIAGVVGETVRQFTSLMEEHSHKVDLVLDENLPEMSVDPDALALALFNLLDNAAKYSEKDRRIEVKVSNDGDSLCIEVTDHGIGIPRAEQEKVFEKFYRVQRTDGKKIPGSGIGLTLVREVAEAHKGKVELHSEPGVGSTFRTRLPIGG